MRTAVVDVGSNTVRLAVADAAGAMPLPVHSAKRRLRLAERVDGAGRLPGKAVRQLVEAVAAARAEAQRWGVDEPFVFATAAVRAAENRSAVVKAVRSGTGMRLEVLSGEAEAQLTFLAARRWMGWQAGPLVLLDIGGGSLEVAFGRGGLPDFAASLPLGAGLLTREFFDGEEIPPKESVRELRRHVRRQLRDTAGRIRWEAPTTAVATSRTFQMLARLCGAAPRRDGPLARRRMRRPDLKQAAGRLAELPAAERALLPGVSAGRAEQSPAGAAIAHTAMKAMGLGTVVICPWSIREGVLLSRIEAGGGKVSGRA